MAEAMLSDQHRLKDAIMEVWTPAVGEQSLQRLWSANLIDILRNIVFCQDTISPPEDVNLFETFISCMVKHFCYMPTRFVTDVTKYFDSHEPFQLEDALVSGSWSEGLFIYFNSSVEMTPPDLDLMCVFKNIKITINDQLNGNLTVQENTPFVNAYITDEESAKLWKDFLHDSSHDHSTNKRQISSKKLKEKLISENLSSVSVKTKDIFGRVSECMLFSMDCEPESAAFTVTSEKPAEATAFDNADSIRSFVNAFQKNQSIQYVSDQWAQNISMMLYKLLPASDIVFAFSCDGWPLCAREWITRERIWPGEDLVKTITQNGFHIVPKSCQSKGDFRLSFSVAETTLIKHLSPLQHKVVKCFKGVVKYHQNSWSTNFKKIVKTYHLKTIALWYCERTTQDSFIKESVDLHLVLLLQELAEALRKQELPMYFMPKVNLFEDVENPEEVIDVVEKIIKLSCSYATLTQTIGNLKKLDPETVIKDVWTGFLTEWKNSKTSGNPKSKNQLSAENSLVILQMLLFQPDCSQDDLKKRDQLFGRLLRNNLDFMTSDIPRSSEEFKR